MGKHLSYIFLIVVLVLLWVFFSRNERKVENFKIEKNSIDVQGLEFRENIKDGGFYIIKAQQAEVSEDFRLISMTECKVFYKTDRYQIEIFSDVCQIIRDENITLKDSITGSFNSYSFKTGEKGLFEYDFKTQQGKVTNGMVVDSEGIKLRSDEGEFDRTDMQIRFIGKVEVDYAG